MSKEQTPMEKQLKDWSPLKFNGEMKWRNEDVIEFANAKVLEALERLKVEISKGENVYNHLEILQLIEIEITEVKPKEILQLIEIEITEVKPKYKL
jgi:hypothetical protein